ncbi:MAG: VWA domain-containing protein [Ignavibacteriae bacterium]|nr:VWA domain-containing protein [Ignavibacteriota bacterium]
MNRRMYVFAAVLFFCATSGLSAGVLYARRPGTETPVYPLRISAIRSTVALYGRLAVTHVDEEFFNDNNLTLEGFYAFQLPEGARVNGLWLWENGQRKIFICLKKEDAVRKYDSVVNGVRRDPALLESLGANRFQLKIFPIAPNSSRRVEIQYFHTLPLSADGYATYRYPLNMAGYQTSPVNVTEMQFNVSSFTPILDLRTTFDDQPMMNRVTKIDESHYRVQFGIEQVNYTRDYELRYKVVDNETVFPALSWKDPNDATGDPYFMTWHMMPADTMTTQGGPRDIVFVLDASGSMDGQRITAVKQALARVLVALRPVDHFRLVLFSSTAISWPSDRGFVEAVPDSITKALEFVNRMYVASGMTNYEAAFTAGLQADFRPSADRRLLFLTDGEPTAGKINAAELLALITRTDTLNVAIYPLLFYTNTIQLLYDIAAARGGRVQMVENSDSLETVIRRVLFDLEAAGVREASVTYLNGKAYMVHPLVYPPFVGGESFISTGRYTGDGKERVRVQWRSPNGADSETTRDVDLAAVDVPVKEVGAYWAAKRIDALLDDVRRYGESAELKNSIIALSIRHSVLSPYTAFLVLETNQIDPPPNAVDEAASPVAFTVRNAYPQPLSLSSGMALSVPLILEQPLELRAVVTDLLGRVVRIITLRLDAGTHLLTWNGRDMAGRLSAPGSYLLRISAGTHSVQQRLVLLR